MSHLLNGNWKSLSAFENKSSKHRQIWSEPSRGQKVYFWPQKFCSNLSNGLYGSSTSSTIYKQLFHNIQIFKLKIFPHILFSEKRNNGSIHISFKTLKYISSENWKSKIILLFDKLMWAFLHLHYSTSFKRDLWIKDYFGERHIQLEYFYFKRFLLLNQSISRAEFEELKLVSKT